MNTIAGKILQNEDLLNSYGVSIKDNNGELLSTKNVLEQLHPIYDKLSSSEQASIATALSGVNQRKIFSAVMLNFQTAIDSTTVAMDSLGSAEIENAKRADSIDAKTRALKASFIDLVTGDGGIVSFIKTLLDAGNAMLKFADNAGGLTTVLIALIGTLIILKGGTVLGAVISGFQSLKLTFDVLKMSVAIAKSEQVAFTTVLWGSHAAATALKLSLGLLTVALTAGFMIYSAVNNEQEKSNRLNQEATDMSIAKIKTLDGVLESLKNESLTRTELNGIVESNISKYSDEISKIDNLTDARQKTIDKIKEQQLEEAKNLISSGQSEYEDALAETTTSKSEFKRTPYSDKKFDDTESTFDKAEGTSEQISALEKYKDTLVEVRGEVKKGGFSYNQYSKEIKKVEAEISSQKKTLSENEKTINAFNDALGATGQVYDSATGKIRKMTKKELENYKASVEAKKAIEGLEIESQELQDTLDSLANITLDSLVDAFDTMRTAQDEMNSTNGLSIETFEKMLSLGDENIAVLFNEAGALDTTQASQLALYKATIDRMAITASMSQIDYASQQVLDNGAGAYADLTNAVKNNTLANWDNVDSALINAELDDRDTTALRSKIDAIHNWAEQAKKSVTITNMGTSATTASTTANKAETDAIEAKNDALKESKKNYESVISYIDSKIDDEMDRLSDLRDAESQAIDDKIEALKKQQESEESYWQAKIDALEEQNDAIQTQIELEELEEALAKAKSAKKSIYREGVGFVYEADPLSVASAQKDLNDFKTQQRYEKQLSDLEAFRDNVTSNYEGQIEDLENYQKEIEAKYDAQIAYYQNWSDKFSDSVDSYENEQNRLMAIQLTGIDFENETWKTRLSQLSSFVSNWNKLQAQLANTTTSTSSSSSGSSGSSGSGGSGSSSSSGSTTQKANPKTIALKKFLNEVFGAGLHLNGFWDEATTQAIKNMQKSMGLSTQTGRYNRATYNQLTSFVNTKLRMSDNSSYQKAMSLGIPKYAKGASSIPKNGMIIAGENPNKEILIGSGLNNGTAIQASSGDGVVNANSTKTFAGLLNSFGKINGANQNYSQNSYSDSNPISISNLNVTLPSVNNGESFVADLKANLKNLSYQRTRG